MPGWGEAGLGARRLLHSNPKRQTLTSNPHPRCVGGRNYLLPSGGGADVFSTSQQVADGGINLHDDVIACLQRKQGTLTMVFLECFTCSPSISSPAGAGKWRTGESWGDSRFPKEFLAHIRPPGTPASEVVVLSNALQARTMDGPMHGLRGIVWPLIAGLPIKVGTVMVMMKQSSVMMMMKQSSVGCAFLRGALASLRACVALRQRRLL